MQPPKTEGYFRRMASFLPLIQDILPMILPTSVAVTKAADILPPEPETRAIESENGGTTTTLGVKVISRHAVVNMTDSMCTSVLVVKPGSSTSVRHHGEQGMCTYLYLLPLRYATPFPPKPKPPAVSSGLVETIIYAVSGKGSLLSQPRGDKEEPERHELGPGDFAFVPAWTEHQISNDSTVDDDTGVGIDAAKVDFHLVIVRNGGSPVEVHLTGWGGPEARPKR
ncbi:hypothetical protein B0J18DRAFT_290555 [Chaetomium sp. MPI-SDFR-AT-0129]|nr:hypothetical protein B0J18DRAFT_290555 [Chaetomium sp. MPI-SDFR-AT-0129]